MANATSPHTQTGSRKVTASPAADNSTLEDIQYHLYVLEKIKRGRADVEEGRVYTHAEAKQRLRRWLQE